MARILLVEDEVSISEPLAYMFAKEGYVVSVAEDGPAAVATFAREGADLILLDLMLPGMPGTDVCKAIRQTSNVPIIMVTAKDSEVDKVLGLELGADDYVTKPFSTAELMARARAVMRRRVDIDLELAPGTVAAGDVRIDIDRHSVTVGNRPVRLPLKEFALLELLVRNAGRVLPRGQLIDRVWGIEHLNNTKTLDVHVKRLRSRIEEDPANPRRLVTVRGVGYKFEG